MKYDVANPKCGRHGEYGMSMFSMHRRPRKIKKLL
jgi:hypothetical protein